MKAIAVFPGQPSSVHLAELPKPSVNEVPNGRGVLVKVLRVGVDGTDKEINAAEYGAAPKGSGLTLDLHICGENTRQATKYRGFTAIERKSC